MWVLRFDPLDQFAFFGMPGNNRVGTLRSLPHRPFGKVEAKTCLPHLWIRTVTTETAIRQDWLHILIKVQTARRGVAAPDESAQNRGSQKCTEGQF